MTGSAIVSDPIIGDERATNPFLALLLSRGDLDADEKAVLGRGFSRVRAVAARQDLVREGDRPVESALIVSGLAARYNLLRSGRRQISAVHIAGDFVDLHSFLLESMDHSVVAVTDCTLAVMPHEHLRTITQTHPHLTRMLWQVTLVDAAIHRRWLVALGGLPATARLAHFLCEMQARLSVVGLTDHTSFALPINQAMLGEILGMSVVHVNRTVQDLRRQGLVIWKGERVQILDAGGLARLGNFNPDYLSLPASKGCAEDT